jgi:hypothetical protein
LILCHVKLPVSYLRPLRNKHLWATMCRGSLTALYPRSNRPVQDRIGYVLTRRRGRSLPPCPDSLTVILKVSLPSGVFSYATSLVNSFPLKSGLVYPTITFLPLVASA